MTDTFISLSHTVPALRFNKSAIKIEQLKNIYFVDSLVGYNTVKNKNTIVKSVLMC